MFQPSNVLVVGPERPHFKDFGVTFVPGDAEARAYLSEHRPAVVVFGDKPGVIGDFEAFCRDVRARCPDARWILTAPSPDQIVTWANEGCLHEVVDDVDDPDLPAKLQSALECKGESEQRRQLLALFEDQSQMLNRLTQTLEARVQKRHRTLTNSLRTLERTRTRLEAFLKALMSIHRAASVPELEGVLKDALHGTVALDWTRVRFDHQSSLRRHRGEHLFAVDLPFRLGDQRGQVVFAKHAGQIFDAAEIDFLTELTDVLALALSRMLKLGQAVISKTEWQSTFDSIPHPLCLVTADLRIVKLNEAFRRACDGRGFRDLLGKRCFDEFFGPEFHPPGDALKFPFTFRHARAGARGTEHFEVSGEGLGQAQLVLLRDITEEVRFERRLLEGSKLAELGTIGSSIAHELNNPLGGMLSFLQLILMDLKSGGGLADEIREMESATLRCRDIVLNLLSFARKQDLGEFKPTDLRAVIARAAKLMELQTRSRAVTLVVSADEISMVSGSANALSQALCYLIQNSVDAIDERRRTEPRLEGAVRVTLTAEKERHLIYIDDNGCGVKPEDQSQIFNPLFTTRDPAKFGGMGLTSAFTLITEHHGSLEILSQTGHGTSAIIGLPRLD